MICDKQVSRYCDGDITKIDNYEQAVSDKTQTWVCHHKGEVLPCGRYTMKQMEQFNLYWHRPPEELIFLTRGEHQRLHLQGVKRPPRSEEWIRNASLAQMGHNPWNKGKSCPQLRGRIKTQEEIRKLSEAKKGRRWFNNGIEQVCQYECPEGWKRGKII